MNRDQIKGRAEQVKGQLKETTGKAVNSERLRSEGVADQVAGKAQAKVGDLKNKVARNIDK